ncbi:melanization protease 1-like isoform X1 [Anopheles stephensi]|uniref:melanization protease 1-like isoform X1 n=1 Tax=Anopheles stephensi TaxID=30069 RepID=UPI0016588F00|nr:melanization protease 1-like isoform X1 [Anopheles stephensi]
MLPTHIQPQRNYKIKINRIRSTRALYSGSGDGDGCLFSPSGISTRCSMITHSVNDYSHNQQQPRSRLLAFESDREPWCDPQCWKLICEPLESSLFPNVCQRCAMMTCPTFVAFARLLPLLLLADGTLAQRQVNQACILTNGQVGGCVRLAECAEIAELANRNVLYLWETQKIRAVLGACESDENSPDPIVCCESGRRRNVPGSTVTASTTTTAAPPTTRRPTTTRRRWITTTTEPITTRPTRPAQLRTSTSPTRRRRITTVSSTTVRSSTEINYKHFRDVLPKVCGMRQVVPTILSGAIDEDNTHVWAVHLEIQKPKETTLARCVGTLIQESYVLTAAHCLQLLPLENIKLFFGVSYISLLPKCLADGDCQERRAAEFIIHPEYNSHTTTNDVALIRVSEPVATSDYIMPACLSLDHVFDERLPDDKRVLSFGWGKTGYGGMSDSKRIVYLNVISPEECSGHLVNSTRISTSMAFSVMCTLGVVRGQDVCQGDSGAPMLHFHKKQYFVVGVVSIGPKCDPSAGSATKLAPGIATRVSEFKRWILATMKRTEGELDVD